MDQKRKKKDTHNKTHKTLAKEVIRASVKRVSGMCKRLRSRFKYGRILRTDVLTQVNRDQYSLQSYCRAIVYCICMQSISYIALRGPAYPPVLKAKIDM